VTETLTHAGTVVFRKRDGQVLYLVVSSSDGANWVLPKGHIDAGESAEVAALRELIEEAGVLGEIVERLSTQNFTRGVKEGIIQYFLIHERGSTTAWENRQLRWEDEPGAIELLSFAEAKAALREGAAMVRRLKPEHQ
jgi:8-oxo-dGTP pyrophosphatase MutT (NUDIX family)